MAGTSGAADSAGESDLQGEFAFPSEDTGNGAGDGEPNASGAGKNDAPVTKETDPLPDPQADAGAAVAENEEPAPGNKETERGQSSDRLKPAWTPI